MFDFRKYQSPVQKPEKLGMLEQGRAASGSFRPHRDCPCRGLVLRCLPHSERVLRKQIKALGFSVV